LKTLRASNGVIYVIDRVLELPPPLNSFFEVLKRNGNFTILLAAFVDVGFVARETSNFILEYEKLPLLSMYIIFVFFCLF
jgi:hypothetical protein